MSPCRVKPCTVNSAPLLRRCLPSLVLPLAVTRMRSPTASGDLPRPVDLETIGVLQRQLLPFGDHQPRAVLVARRVLVKLEQVAGGS